MGKKIDKIQADLKQLTGVLNSISQEVNDIQNENEIEQIEQLVKNEIKSLEANLIEKNKTIYDKLLMEIKSIFEKITSKFDTNHTEIKNYIANESSEIKKHFDSVLLKKEEQDKIKEERLFLKDKVSNQDKEIKYLQDDNLELKKENSSLITDKQQLNFETNQLKEKLDKLEDEKNGLEKDISLKEEEIETLNNTNTKFHKDNEIFKNKIETFQEEKKNLESKIKDLENSKEELNKLKEIPIKEFQEVFMEDNLMKLLDSILKNPTLEQFRKEKKIIDKMPQSIFNLLVLLYSAREFVNGYYDYLVSYKKDNQEEMSNEEIKFYNEINNYFGKKVISNPTQRFVEEDKFDKAIHRSIDLRYRDVKLADDKIILIPADTVGHDKIKVKIN